MPINIRLFTVHQLIFSAGAQRGGVQLRPRGGQDREHGCEGVLQGGEQGGDVPLQAGAGRVHGHHTVPQEADREGTHSYMKLTK